MVNDGQAVYTKMFYVAVAVQIDGLGWAQWTSVLDVEICLNEIAKLRCKQAKQQHVCEFI